MAHAHFATAAPTLKEWEQLGPVVREMAQPETLIVVTPSWAEPNARLVLGDELMPLSHVARADESRFGRILEISILGERHPEADAWQLEQERREGAFALRTWKNSAAVTPQYDFLVRAQPPDLSVSVHGANGESEPCAFSTNQKVSNGDLGGHPTFPRRRFVCPGRADWAFVGRTVIEDQEYRPRQCIWAHPIQRSVLVLRFDAVPIGSKIQGYGGLPYLFERDGRGTPIDLSVSVGGEEIGTVRHVDGEGWKRFEFSTDRFIGQRLPVEFRVRSKREARREFCFQADVR